jgi:hypothetical protein
MRCVTWVIPSTSALCSSWRVRGEEDEACHQRGFSSQANAAPLVLFSIRRDIGEKGSEALCVVDPIDGFAVHQLKEFDGRG